MAQGDIIDLLKRRKRWLTTKEIADSLGVGISCTLVKLRKLRKRNEIKCIDTKKPFLYRT